MKFLAREVLSTQGPLQTSLVRHGLTYRSWVVGSAIALLSACGGGCFGTSQRQNGSAATPASGTNVTKPDVATTTPPSEPAPAPLGPPAPLTTDMAVPFFAGVAGPAGEAAKFIELDQWDQALPLLQAAIAASTSTTETTQRLTLLLAVAQEQTKQWAAAAATYATVAPAFAAIADYIHYHRARSLYFAHDMAALAEARAVGADSIHGADAELLVGDIIRSAPDVAATAAHYRSYLQRRPKGARRSEARFRLAEAIEAQRKKDPALADSLVAEMVSNYRQIAIDEPLSSWVAKADVQLAALSPSLPPAIAATIGTYTIDERMTQAMELFDGMRNPESEAAFTALLAMPGVTPAQECKASYNRAQSRFKARDRQGAKIMFDDAAAACKDAGDKDLQIKSNYQAGRSYSFVKEHDVAIARYQVAQSIDASNSYADDAQLREAEEWASLNNDAKVREVLGSLPDKFPTGDMRADAMWRLGFRSWRDKKYDEAISFWQKQITVMPIDDNYYAEGQAQYWLGRAYMAKKDRKAALASWRDAVMMYPAAYYAMQALNRIKETDAKAFAAILKEISTDPAGFDAKAPAFTFSPRPEWGSQGFARASLLMRLGLGDSAASELRKLGLAAPPNKKRVADPDQIEKLWAMSYLYDRAGNYGTSHWPTRWHILDYRRTWPIGANRARWNIAYPKAYWPLLTEHAKLNNLPVAMQIAIVREESAFDPLLESYANAVGLTQMIFPTAKRFAQGTGIEVSRDTLRDPVKNVTIGSRFLGFLFKNWNNYTLLVPPSYNAGEAGVGRMLKVRGTWDADEFIEGIVDDQARNYSKRVLGTFFTYSWLYQQIVPEIPLKIPTELLPK
jgi:soluble lytic murein transglycosylase